MNSSNHTKQFKNSAAWYVVLGLALFFIDQYSKFLVYSKGMGGFLSEFMPVIGKQIFPNYNFAFSLPVPNAVAYIIYAVLLGGLAIWYWKNPKKTVLLNIGMVLVLAGAAGNIYDRLALGYVRDFIYIFWGNIFNLADLFILGGIILLLV